MRRTETPKPIWIKFCTVVDIPEVVTYTNFGDHRLRGFGGGGGQISPSPIDFHRRPYNTLALPFERVMCWWWWCSGGWVEADEYNDADDEAAVTAATVLHRRSLSADTRLHHKTASSHRRRAQSASRSSTADLQTHVCLLSHSYSCLLVTSCDWRGR